MEGLWEIIHSSTQTGTPPLQVPARRSGAGGAFTVSSPRLGQQFLSHCTFLPSTPSKGSLGSQTCQELFCTSFENHVHIFHLYLDIVACMSCYLQAFICFFAGRAGAEVQSWQTTPAGKSYLLLVVCFTCEISHFLMTGKKIKLKESCILGHVKIM